MWWTDAEHGGYEDVIEGTNAEERAIVLVVQLQVFRVDVWFDVPL